MILMLVILYLSRKFTHAAPTSLLDDSTVTLLTSTTQPSSAYRERSIWDIIWSCLATIFACSWVSVHPNIPPRNEKWWMAPLRRLELMVWAIIAPELMILWAMRQWFGARKLAKVYQDRGWTKTHGYFLQMGGFALFKGENFQGVLYHMLGLVRAANEGDEDIQSLAGEKFPMTTEEEIQDRSKSDGLSKALAIGQTSWFALQCIARRIKGLYITELELATGAFAVLNGAMYFFWWNKPLAVRCPVRIQMLDNHTPGEQPENDVTLQTKTTRFTIPPSAIIFGIFSRLRDMFDSSWGGGPGSTFYASTEAEDDLLAMKGASVAAIIFGGIHCAAWVFTFPSHAESIIWRICSIAITTIPFTILTFTLAVDWSVGWLADTAKVLTEVSIPFYMIARLLLLAEAFATLRHLPPEAYEVVRWVTFIPHI